VPIRFREPVNGLTHFLAAILAAVGWGILLYLGRHDSAKEISLSIYGVSLVLLFACSATYHAVCTGPKTLERLRKLDHSAIYLQIAGTYTPFCTLVFHGFWSWGLLAIIWTLAGLGILVKMFILKAPRWVTAGVYVAMGWLSMIAVGEMWRTLSPGALIWLMVGGLLYTGGAVVYITKRLDFFPGRFGFHEVWHLFVVFGSLAHFISIAAYLAPSG
jgi:hemolysin III